MGTNQPTDRQTARPDHGEVTLQKNVSSFKGWQSLQTMFVCWGQQLPIVFQQCRGQVVAICLRFPRPNQIVQGMARKYQTRALQLRGSVTQTSYDGVYSYFNIEI